jgi:hypothetical protein
MQTTRTFPEIVERDDCVANNVMQATEDNGANMKEDVIPF